MSRQSVQVVGPYAYVSRSMHGQSVRSRSVREGRMDWLFTVIAGMALILLLTAQPDDVHTCIAETGGDGDIAWCLDQYNVPCEDSVGTYVHEHRAACP